MFELGLIGVRKELIRQTDVTVEIYKGGSTTPIERHTGLSFPPARPFTVPAFPQAHNLHCEVTAPRYRFRNSGVFTFVDGETIRRELTMVRDSRLWQPRFLRWNDLPNDFRRFQRVLSHSKGVGVRKTQVTIASMTERGYDDVADNSALAKAGLLNVVGKLSTMTVPGKRRPWFSYIERILEIDRERIIAVVNASCADAVRAIRNNIAAHNDYKHTPAGNHFGNMPVRYGVPKSKMFSVKSTEAHGNVQLTIGPGKDPDTGRPAFILDADIDENGKLIPHLFDALFRHRFNGGTHPLDIHEYLALSQPDAPIGYELV